MARLVPDLIGLRLDDPVDWSEVAELIEDSYCLLAPRRLVDQLSKGDISSGCDESALVTDRWDAGRPVRPGPRSPRATP